MGSWGLIVGYTGKTCAMGPCVVGKDDDVCGQYFALQLKEGEVAILTTCGDARHVDEWTVGETPSDFVDGQAHACPECLALLFNEVRPTAGLHSCGAHKYAYRWR